MSEVKPYNVSVKVSKTVSWRIQAISPDAAIEKVQADLKKAGEVDQTFSDFQATEDKS